MSAQPDWPAIKSDARFVVADSAYGKPFLQPLQVGGWEDGLYLSRDGLRLYCTYIPGDFFSYIFDYTFDPPCFDFKPYFRPPLLGVDTLTNPLGCPNFIQSDVVRAERTSVDQPFREWKPSRLARSVTSEGGAQEVARNADSLSYFVFTRNWDGETGEDKGTQILFLRNKSNDPDQVGAVPIVETPDNEDNPHLEELEDGSLVLLFDRDRWMYYATSTDSGKTWTEAEQITQTLNDQAPFDTQPHLWFDGTDWWVFFRAGTDKGQDGIFKARQTRKGDWDSWGERQLIVSVDADLLPAGRIVAMGEPSVTQWGDLSFAVVYGDILSADSTDVFDADPWFLPIKGSPVSEQRRTTADEPYSLRCSPNPASDHIILQLPQNMDTQTCVLSIWDISGRKVREQGLESQVDIRELPEGLYTLRLEVGSESSFVRFVKF